MIEIFHISTDEIIVDDLTKMLLSNKFKEFVELIRVSKIELSNSKPSDGKSNDSNKNNENFVTNYYKKADEEVSQF